MVVVVFIMMKMKLLITVVKKMISSRIVRHLYPYAAGS